MGGSEEIDYLGNKSGRAMLDMRERSIRIEKLSADTPVHWFYQIAEIHKSEIPGGFLSSLDTRFLVRMYQTFSSSKHAFLLAATSEDFVVGFICCSLQTKEAYRDFMLRSGAHSFFILIKHVFSLKMLARIIEVLAYPKRNASLDLPPSEILNFSVRHEFQRRGLGTALFAAAIEEYGQAEIDSIKIVVGANQSGAIKFYDSMHAIRKHEFCLHEKQRSYVFTFDASDAEITGFQSQD